MAARNLAHNFEIVMAGLVPATPIMWLGRAKLIGVAGTSPGDDGDWRLTSASA